MIGMPKEQVFACMGIPSQKAKEGAVEVWTYPSGSNRIAAFGSGSVQAPSGTANDYGTASVYGGNPQGFCTVSIAFQDGKVSQVNYVGPTGRFEGRGEQCAYAVRNCLPKSN
jgi:outer membrane protein assembly factor BamE (lipoprotein component of BamABCDE complex)